MSTDHFVVSVQDEETYVVVQEQQLTSASSGIYNPLSIEKVADIGDVDTSVLQNGSVLVYNTNVSKWKSTLNLDLQNMEGGEY